MIIYSLKNISLKALEVMNLIWEEIILTSQGCLFDTCTKREINVNIHMMIMMKKTSKLT